MPSLFVPTFQTIDVLGDALLDEHTVIVNFPGLTIHLTEIQADELSRALANVIQANKKDRDEAEDEWLNALCVDCEHSRSDHLVYNALDRLEATECEVCYHSADANCYEFVEATDASDVVEQEA
jgi:hypothetical protein